jgi:dTDP-4-dehydrorhamnose reductase
MDRGFMSVLHAHEEKGPVWLLGVNSMLGWSIATQAHLARLELYCNPHTRIPRGARWRPLGLQNRAEVAAAFARETPSLVIHCAGICDVEKCETSPAFAHAVNVQGMDNLLRHAPASTRLVYVSSDHVFSGDSGPYTESSPPDPISYYGHTRVAAEAMLRERRPDALIVRAGLWIGPSYNGRLGHLDWLRYRSARDLPMTLVRDEHRSAVWADQAAERTLALALSDISGIRHVVAERVVARPALAHYLNQRFAIGARLETMARIERRVPHLGQVTLRTEYRDALATPLAPVVPPSALAPDDP